MTGFGRFHPAALLSCFAAVIFIAMFTQNPAMQTLSLAGASTFCFLTSDRGKRSKKILFYVAFFLLFAFTNPLFSQNGATVIFYLGSMPVMLESLLYGVSSGIMLVSVMLWFEAYTRTVTSDKFIFLFGKIFPSLALVLSTILRFIPMFLRQAKRIDSAQKTLGAYSGENFISKIRGRLRVLSALVTWALENAMDTAASMKARGYGLRGRSSFSVFRFTKSDALLFSISLLLLSVVIAATANDALEFIYYPIIMPPRFSFLTAASYASYTVLVFLPCFVELEEKIRWKYCISKI